VPLAGIPIVPKEEGKEERKKWEERGKQRPPPTRLRGRKRERGKRSLKNMTSWLGAGRCFRKKKGKKKRRYWGNFMTPPLDERGGKRKRVTIPLSRPL